jgi:PKD repeat protein
VTFTNLSSSATGYQWSFGDGSTLLTTGGSTSALENPTHTYTQTGTFTVTLTATAGSEGDTEIKTDYISVTAGIPVTLMADFVATPISGSVPLTVTFTNLSHSSDPVQSYQWDFGDGSTLLTTSGAAGTLESPTHVYTQTGSFTVTLTATVGNQSTGVPVQSDIEVKRDYISVTSGVTVTADFSAAPSSGSAPLAVIFRNRSTSSGELDGFRWDFGDGSTPLTTGGEVSTLENPIHVYTRTGVFTVTLTATAGGKSAIMMDHISVTALSLTSVRAPQVSIVTPVEGTILGEGEVWVTGVVSDDGTVTEMWVAGVPARGNDIPATLTDNTFSLTIAQPGTGCSLVRKN